MEDAKHVLNSSPLEGIILYTPACTMITRRLDLYSIDVNYTLRAKALCEGRKRKMRVHIQAFDDPPFRHRDSLMRDCFSLSP